MPMNISSRKNELVREYLQLSASDVSCRREQGKLPLEGARLCCDAAESGLKVLSLLYTEEASEKYGRYLETIRRAAPTEYLISQSVAQAFPIRKIRRVCFVSAPCRRKMRNFRPSPAAEHFLMLENIQDPANLGAILRTAEAVGMDGVIPRRQLLRRLFPESASRGYGRGVPSSDFPERKCCGDAVAAERELAFTRLPPCRTGLRCR